MATIEDVVSALSDIESKLESIECAIDNLNIRDGRTGTPLIEIIKEYAYSADHGIWKIKEIVENRIFYPVSIYPILQTIFLGIIVWKLI